MAIAIITNWLQGKRDYRTGVELFNEFGASDFLKRMFSSRETAFNKKKLIECLQEINKSQAVVLDMPQKKFFPARWIEEKQYAGLPEAVKDLMAKKELMFKEMRRLHSQLELLNEKSVKECGKAAFMILDLQDQINNTWTKLDYYQQHQKLPDQAPAKQKLQEMSREDLLRRKLTLRTYVTRGFGKYREELEMVEKILAK